MSNDLLKLSLEILDLVRDEAGLLHICEYTGNTILHDIVCSLEFPGEGCCKDKWLSFLSKIANRFPADILSTQNIAGHTPYDRLINNYSYYHDEKLIEEVLEILKPR